MTAYHEAGHALWSPCTSRDCDPVHKATIIPRGRALGLVMSLPEGDRLSAEQGTPGLRAKMVMAMGGRVAEEIIFGPTTRVSTGAGE